MVWGGSPHQKANHCASEQTTPLQLHPAKLKARVDTSSERGAAKHGGKSEVDLTESGVQHPAQLAVHIPGSLQVCSLAVATVGRNVFPCAFVVSDFYRIRVIILQWPRRAADPRPSFQPWQPCLSSLRPLRSFSKVCKLGEVRVLVSFGSC